MEFQKPEIVTDVVQSILLSSLALAKVQYGDPISAIEDLPSIWKGVAGELEAHPENVVWTFLANCVGTAVITVLRQPRLHCELEDEELKTNSEKMIGLIPDQGSLDARDLTNLSLSESISACVDHIPAHVRHAAPDHRVTDDDLKRMFQDALAQSVTKVFDRQYDLFKGLVAAISGPTSEAERRSIAWKRHDAWIRDQFTDEPIFSPDSVIDIPLSQIYLNLRCHWNEAREKEVEAQRSDPLRYRTANIADLHSAVHYWLKNAKNDDALRLVAGAPGSGKSSFAKAFGAELVAQGSHRVLFIGLQHVEMHGTLRESIGRYLTSRHGFQLPNKCEGFPQNPLEWHGEDHKPLLIIFDGLDELTANKDREKDLTRQIVSNLKLELSHMNAAGPPARAIVLGRDVA